MSLIRGQILKYTFLGVWPSQKFFCTKNSLIQSFVAKFWCLEVPQLSRIWLNKHHYMHIKSFLISTILMFTESYCCIRVDFFIFWTTAWLFSTICQAYYIAFIFEAAWFSGGATQPLPRNGEAKELRREPTAEPQTRAKTAEPKTDLHRGLETRQTRKRWLRSCRRCP